MSDLALSLLSESLIGKRVKSATKSNLTLDDGTVIELFESAQDCCAAAYGDWALADAVDLDAAITAVELTSEEQEDYDSHYTSGELRIMHNQNPIALGDLYAGSGNGGYYYSVLSVKVHLPNGGSVQTELISS
ncbi:hypothetical protein SEA_SEPHIROTH_62 [Gordonia Phage Sephiroth]|uniref:DUF7448 domain-containing protein n=1 Tax=Gordonia Phage Sephiroth TaxID=2767553 RepID=A0A7G9UZE9_9CAUD|nr:hypothetical protein L3Y23_gp062 [Gordonia Phage Sephiroth]QNN99404.1 hypothetical protein SEA_SEPHIROTH_62 [Gordonia Phage Sephiroth]